MVQIPLTVSLPDGREAAITPDPKAIARYMVARHFFERMVRRALSDLFLQDPTKVTVLGGGEGIGVHGRR